MARSLLQDELNASIHQLRGSLTELLVSVGADPHRPQDVSRRFKLDKSLAWKVSRVVNADHAHQAVQHMPGEAAFDILLTAMQQAGAAQAALARTRAALRSFQSVVQRHVGDRPTLELVLDGLPNHSKDRLSLSRKLAFRGNSGIWGVQARVRVNTIFLAPSPSNPEMIDNVLVGGWVDFRRLRADAPWTLFRRRAYREGVSVPSEEEPLDPTEPRTGPMLLREFCSDTLPPIEATEQDGAVVYKLGPTPVGNTGNFTYFFGTLHRQLGSRLATSQDDQAAFHAMISAPVEVLLFDLLVHHSLTFALKPRLSVYGAISSDLWTRLAEDRLPIEAEPRDLGRRPPEVSTPLVREYKRVVDHAFKCAGWDPADFVGLRYTLEHPPFPSTVVVAVDLEPRQAVQRPTDELRKNPKLRK